MSNLNGIREQDSKLEHVESAAREGAIEQDNR